MHVFAKTGCAFATCATNPASPHQIPVGPSIYLESQVAGNNRPLYPKVNQYWFKVAHHYEPLALQVDNAYFGA